MTALRECPELASLPVAVVDHLAAVGVERTFDDGEDVIVQGSVGDEFSQWSCPDGRASVRDGHVVAGLLPGNGFGEMALFATVRAQPLSRPRAR